MLYVSTRGNSERVPASQAIKQGIASDGGLFIPEKLPLITLDEILKLSNEDYVCRAATVLGKFLCDYTFEELSEYARKAYASEKFGGNSPAPVVQIDDDFFVLELYHGPTCAFKDMALQIMPHLLAGALEKTGEERDAFILTATSGDTGKAALEGYRDVDHVKIMVFYPVDGVSRVQKLQMSTQEGNNVSVCPVKGNFDDAQSGVKKLFADSDVSNYLDRNGFFFSSANSINWGRLAPQIVYYVSAYCDMVKNGSIKLGEVIDVCVPTGNFGNIFAAYIAKCCGLPLGRLVCASNKNRILTDFFENGVYDRNRDFYTTMSPSMDILISSNIERLLYFSVGSAETARYMSELSQKGIYKVPERVMEKLRETFVGMTCDETGTSECIKRIYNKYNYLCDTHTAVGIDCAQRAKSDGRKILSVSTASPYKFASDVYRSLSNKRFDDEFDNIDALSQLTGTSVPLPLALLKTKTIKFDPEKSILPDNMADFVKKASDVWGKWTV